MSRVVLAMSGGVDSSVAAYLLKKAGHDVIGVFMRHGEKSAAVCSLDEVGSDGNSETGVASNANAAQTTIAPLLPVLQTRAAHKQGCCSAQDAEDARRVADRLEIPFYALNLEEEFRDIIDYFVDEYTNGRTPNPCVMCNTHIKFGRLFEFADSVEAPFVASGHYARLLEQPGEATPALTTGIDSHKDQSYALFGIEKSMLSRMLFPVGEYDKLQIRAMALEVGLDVAEKKDSQEICFVTSGKHDEFVRARRGNVDRSGEIVTTEGQVVGQHPGIERFTIGQRKGLRVAMGEPYFVVRIDVENCQVIIGKKEELARVKLIADRANWLVDSPADSFRCSAKIRYNSPAAPATVQRLDDDRFQVVFDEPRFGVAPGQAVVCYDQERVLGGGWIFSSE